MLVVQNLLSEAIFNKIEEGNDSVEMLKQDKHCVYVKVMKQGKHRLVAACDADLLGRTLKFGNITFEVRREFYEGSLLHVKEALKIIKKASIINLVGSIIIEEVLKEELIHPDAIIKISGIPHAQIISI